MKYLSVVALVAFIATVYAANWALNRYGTVSVVGLTAPAGVFFAGLALCLRDFIQETLGRYAVVAAIVAGAVISWRLGADAVIPGGHVSIALASGLAFLLSEFADLAVYTPLRERSVVAGLIGSNVVGAVVDSALFLWLAFGGLMYFGGQVAGKVLVTIPALVVLGAWRLNKRQAAFA